MIKCICLELRGVRKVEVEYGFWEMWFGCVRWGLGWFWRERGIVFGSNG